jgi:hypothetical protein
MTIVRKVVLLLTISLLYSCIHEESNETTSIIENLSGQRITITPYNNGVALTQDAHVVERLERKVVQRGGARGKNNSFPYSDNIQSADSVVVIFGNGIQAVHYSFSVSGNNNKAIKRNSPRSLFNRDNFKRVVVSETKYTLADEYTYTFTTQDYLDATK